VRGGIGWNPQAVKVSEGKNGHNHQKGCELEKYVLRDSGNNSVTKKNFRVSRELMEKEARQARLRGNLAQTDFQIVEWKG